MIRFRCQACGAVLNIAEEYAGRSGKCPKCAQPVVVPQPSASETPANIPPAGPPSPPAAVPQPPGAPPVYGDQTCPSCGQPLVAGVKICMNCGIYTRSGRPVLVARGLDEDTLEERTVNVLCFLSWIVPWGIYPIYSEAPGKSRAYVTWSIAVLTVLISVWFWAYDWTDSPKMQSYKNLMLWAGEAEPTAEHIGAFYDHTGYGDADAFLAKCRELAPECASRNELAVKAHAALTPEQRCLGEFRVSQLITHAFLHGGIFHLAGNLLFLFILGARVNAAVGNVATAVIYPLLAVLAGLIYKAMAASGMPVPMLGASGAIMGMAGAYLVLFPAHKIHMACWFRWGLIRGFKLSRKIFAVRGFWVVLAYIALDVIFVAAGVSTGTAHWAHLGGFMAGVAAGVILLVTRLAYSGGDLLSLVLGKYAWPLMGSPVSRRQQGPSFRPAPGAGQSPDQSRRFPSARR